MIREIKIDLLSASTEQPTLLYPGEIEILTTLARLSGAGTVIEFGVHNGETAHALLAAVPSIERYIGIDVLPGYQTPLPQQQSEVPNSPGHLVSVDRRFYLVLRANGSYDLTQTELPMANFIFIDGDHSRRGVLNDTKLALLLLLNGGIVAWHDFYDEMDDSNVAVKPVLEELATREIAKIYRVKGTHLAFARPYGRRFE